MLESYVVGGGEIIQKVQVTTSHKICHAPHFNIFGTENSKITPF